MNRTRYITVAVALMAVAACSSKRSAVTETATVSATESRTEVHAEAKDSTVAARWWETLTDSIAISWRADSVVTPRGTVYGISGEARAHGIDQHGAEVSAHAASTAVTGTGASTASESTAAIAAEGRQNTVVAEPPANSIYRWIAGAIVLVAIILIISVSYLIAARRKRKDRND